MNLFDLEQYRIPEQNNFRIGEHRTTPLEVLSDAESKEIIARNVSELADIQERMYANQKRSALIVFQAMDAAGKDGTIERLVTGINPQGVKVSRFIQPTPLELRHHFLWRVHSELPARGIIGIFNRSHYEEVLVTRVHPKFLLPQDLPGIDSPGDVTDSLWMRRYTAIRNFEKNLYDTGTTVIKFFLNVSKAEQKNRLLARLNNPDKHWKFNINDVYEREQWPAYMQAYEDAIKNTSTEHCPWYMIPADDKDTMRALVTSIATAILKAQKEDWPSTSSENEGEINKGKQLLEKEAQ